MEGIADALAGLEFLQSGGQIFESSAQEKESQYQIVSEMEETGADAYGFEGRRECSGTN